MEIEVMSEKCLARSVPSILPLIRASILKNPATTKPSFQRQPIPFRFLRAWRVGRFLLAFSPLAAIGQSSPEVKDISCSRSSVLGSGTDSCSVALTAAAGSGGVSITLTSSNSAVTVPAKVSISEGAAAGAFNAQYAAVTSTQTAVLTAGGSSNSSSFSIQLNGDARWLTVNSKSVSFGDVALNSPATQSITLKSTGLDAVTVTSAKLSGTGFSMEGASIPVTLSPNQTLTLDLEFDPAQAGAASGELIVTSNASADTTDVVTLAGTGKASSGSGSGSGSYQVNMSWDAPGGSLTISGYRIYRAISGSSSYSLLNSSLDAETSYSDATPSAGTTYDYYVESVDSAGVSSAPSTVLSIAVP
jgi:Abnormal spindle-like microcephaly-assoc'd, ASPM-SPD-2-Hydin